MRTGSIGNRDAETLIKTLVEPKRTLLGNLRKELLSLGFSEEAGYDAINIESYVSYSLSGKTRFIFKHKWNLSVVLILQDEEERKSATKLFPGTAGLTFARNEDDGTVWAELDPKTNGELILQVAHSFVSTEEE